MIKKGEVNVSDKYYNYMYHLNPGSYFGEMHSIFGIRSYNYYRFRQAGEG